MNLPLPSTRLLTSLAAVALLLTACQTPPAQRPNAARDAIAHELRTAATQRPAAPKAADPVSQAPLSAAPLSAAPLSALVPSLVHDLPRPTAVPEQRFALSVSGATVAQVFHAIASGSRYSILVPPGVTGTVTVDLKDVTVREALDVLRELYGFEYRIDGVRIYIQPAALQTRIFQVSYPTNRRVGRSDTRISSGAMTSTPTTGTATAATPGGSPALTQGSQVSTTTDSDFWKELEASLKTVVGNEEGRQIVISQHTGVVVVKGFPKDLRAVEDFLRSAKLSIERQVMLEAKIVEVGLADGAQTGINWALLAQGNHRLSVGADTTRINVPGSIGRSYGVGSGSITTTVDTGSGSTTPTVTATTLGQLLTNPLASGGAGLLGLAFTNNTFNGLLAFLETQGSVHVLSSPRVAALNNEKAVLRVGTDDFFITNISTTTTASASGSVTTPTITVQPFFSGISLDVTPQIDEDGMVTMHVRPSVSNVSEKNRIVNLGNLGSFNLPLASSSVNETDTVVRVQDGAIVAIGGLMQQAQSDNRSQVPGAGDVPVAGHLFKRTDRNSVKRELVFLIKPTILKGDGQWRNDATETEARVRQLGQASQKE